MRIPSAKYRPKISLLGLSLIAPIYYGLLTLGHTLRHPYIVQDDARQHVVWFWRSLNPALFPDDPIADYFQTLAPLGFRFVYGTAADLGIDPLLLARLLPLPLALIATIYLFRLTWRIIPSPLSAWLATLIFNQHLWLNDDLVSATPRAFVYPLFAMFLDALVGRSLLPCLLALGGLGLFFPQMMLVGVAVLGVRLLTWRGGRPALSQNSTDWWFALAGLGVAIAIALPFTLNLSDYGPAVTAAQMRHLPEYGLGGRNEYFGVHPVTFLLHGSSGLRIPVFPSVIWAGFALPVFLRQRSTRRETPLLRAMTPNLSILVHLLAASLGMYGLAHLLLLRLHFPSRYTYHSWRFGLAIAAGIVVAAVLERVWRWWQQRWREGLNRRDWLIGGIWATLLATVVLVPAFPPLVFAFQGWIIGDQAAIYEYLAQQPPETVVASMAAEADNLPAFAHRSTFVGREFVLPHHPRYYAEMTDRATRLIRAQYSPDATDLRSFLASDRINFILLDRQSFQLNYLEQDWLIHSSLQPVTQAAINQLRGGKIPAIATVLSRCQEVSNATYILLNAECVKTATATPSAN
ncbi:MAG: hypothetical protein VKK04_21115 [Synechococcales bacterium]|nr:hypothetical protein [Synechococcales bacterium]